MNEIFKKRRAQFYAQNLKYLRYVFNDHFTLFLVILLGALAIQYAQFLQSHTLSGFEKGLVMCVVSLIALIPGRLATFFEAADQVFLLVREHEIKQNLKQSFLRSMILPALVSVILVFVSSPLLLFPIWVLMLWFLLLLGLKSSIFAYRLKKWQNRGLLNWRAMIAYEENRKVVILRFFALFTTVKGLKSHSHRRKYLDFLLPKTRRTYEYALSRSFLRSGDYLALTVRLTVLSILALIFVDNAILAVILVCVFNALLMFQLVALRDALDYQLLARLYPIKKGSQASAVKRILFRVLVGMTGLQVIFGLVFLTNRLDLIIILLVNGVLAKFYLSSRLKNKF